MKPLQFLRVLVFLFLCLGFAVATAPAAPGAQGVSGDPLKGKDLLEGIKLVSRAEQDEKLSDDEMGRVQIMVAYLKGFTDGMHPMQIFFPQGPVAIPDSVTMGQFARKIDEYLNSHAESLEQPTALVLFNAAFEYYRNPNFVPGLMPRRVPLPTPEPKK